MSATTPAPMHAPRPGATDAARADASAGGTRAGVAQPAALRVQGLSLTYGDRAALRDIAFAVAPGEQFALLGPNGSGKSTLLRILSTLLRPATGRVEVDGLAVPEQSAAARHRLGVVFQASTLDAKLTVAENLRFQGRLYNLGRRVLGERVGELLAQFALTDRAGDRAGTLSGGLRRRVELAKALLHRPRVLLLDEPTAGLDLAAREAFWHVLGERRAGDGLTVIVATHLMDEAERCDRVALLDQGSLVALDTPTALKRELGEAVLTLESADPAGLLRLLGERMGLRGAVSDGVVRLQGEAEGALVPQLLQAFPAEIVAVRVGRPTLADVFLARTGSALAPEAIPGDAA